MSTVVRNLKFVAVPFDQGAAPLSRRYTWLPAKAMNSNSTKVVRGVGQERLPNLLCIVDEGFLYSKLGQITLNRIQNLTPLWILSTTEAATRASSFQRVRMLFLAQDTQKRFSSPLTEVFKIDIPV